MHTLTIKIENDSATGAVIDFLETMKNRGVSLVEDEVDELIEEVLHSCSDYSLIKKTEGENSITFDKLMEEFNSED